MTDQTLADIAKNGRERVRVSLCEYRGSHYADIRIYATTHEGASVPTTKGVSLRKDMLRATIKALETAERLFDGDAA